jgi:hypothetical protein
MGPNLAFFAVHDERLSHCAPDHGGTAIHLRVDPDERLGVLIAGFDVIYDFFDRHVKRRIAQRFFWNESRHNVVTESGNAMRDHRSARHRDDTASAIGLAKRLCSAYQWRGGC